ncbi:hypothetical protein M5X11_01465 [Paenibacillus alginolyticus]|uniref:Uncharacterized protein n=1 Tax=Paenibacillus alginolyticus TaxID=59839 RepID=A0ABT4G751_9BACL|nr:hypothetical protein [Paenibacillus alginolyticus]MCY9663652.1 hypothetical protein [Paenibacillus alginolyticus]MCY9692006.1 hypothetical protein [Paenibacillus alginolyticus]MEC0144196.1 hypothetical protein [Paenibacillus alginolyticus]
MAKKLDSHTLNLIKEALSKMDVNYKKVNIDLESGDITEDPRSMNIEDLLALGKGISKERAKEWAKDVEEARNDW